MVYPPFRILGSDNCVYCTKARSLLDQYKIPYVYVNVSEDDREKQNLIRQGLKTVPQVWDSQNNYVGGFNSLNLLVESTYGNT